MVNHYIKFCNYILYCWWCIDGSIFSNLIVGIFFILIGLIIFISGLKVVIKDNKIKRYGIQCYGIIRLL